MSNNTNTRVQEMIAHLNGLPDAALGFSAKKFYETGAAYKVTCREILTNFLGKEKAVSRGHYLAVAPTVFQQSRKEKAVKPIVVKAPKEPKAPKAVKEPKAPKGTKSVTPAQKKADVKPAQKAAKKPAAKAVVKPAQARVNGRFVKATPAA